MTKPGARATGVLGPSYSEEEIAALQAEVLPRYLAFFQSLAVDRLNLAPPGRVAAMGILASSLALAVAERAPAATVVGFDPSESGVRTRRSRPSSHDLEALTSLPLKHPDASFSHVVAVHPLTPPAERRRLLAEARRVLQPAGQLLLTLPLRGSFAEVSDMLREFALKSDSTMLAEAVEIAAVSRPTPETLTEELEAAGFDDVTVSVELLSVPFETGRDFAGHPLFGLVVGPDVAAALGLPNEAVAPALEYVEQAIGKYWSDGAFELGVNLGCVSAIRP